MIAQADEGAGWTDLKPGQMAMALAKQLTNTEIAVALLDVRFKFLEKLTMTERAVLDEAFKRLKTEVTL
jgi:hypothetical protein